MSALDSLRQALASTNAQIGHRFRFDFTPIDAECARLAILTGHVGSQKPPARRVQEALEKYRAHAIIETFRHARYLSFGCAEQLADEWRLIEDRERFPRLLGFLEQYAQHPKALRQCYRGLLATYFSYDGEHEDIPESGTQNWRALRSFLQKTLPLISNPEHNPAWIAMLRAHEELLTEEPGTGFAEDLLQGNPADFNEACTVLDISGNSWLIEEIVLEQIDAACNKHHDAFVSHLPHLLDLLKEYPLLTNMGLPDILTRYARIPHTPAHPELRDFSVSVWGTPGLTSNDMHWSLVAAPVRKMVDEWVNLQLIQQFFTLLAEDKLNNPRRLKFWERYYRQIDSVYFALGTTAREMDTPDFIEIRKKMGNRLLHLHSAGSPLNNAFILFIGRCVIVEFGLASNACYIFDRDNLPFALSGDVAGDMTELKHPRHKERLLHRDSNQGTWESRFEQIIYGLTRARPGDGTLSIQTDAPRTRAATAARPSPPSRQGTFSDAIFQNWCQAQHLQFTDKRHLNGNLWVWASDRNIVVKTQLMLWGFVYSPGKEGWYRK